LTFKVNTWPLLANCAALNQCATTNSDFLKEKIPWVSSFQYQLESIMEKITSTTNELRNKPADGYAGDNKPSLSSSLNHAENALEPIKESAISTFNEAKSRLLELEHAMLAKGQEAGKASRIYIYQNPFKSVLAASAVGLVLGFTLSLLRK
jgi:ElaB/YqjD/DUF883 family membrane-anchored ribosome-binding protein